MDTLSTLLADIRIRDARFIRTRFDASGHLVVRETSQPCFHIVTTGRLWLRPSPDLMPIAMQAGDVAFFPRGQAHVLAGQPLPPARGEVDMQSGLAPSRARPGQVLDLPATKRTGMRADGVGRSISGCMLIDGVADAWLWGALPPYLLVRWGDRALPTWLQIGLAYLEQELDRDQLARQAIINRLGDILFMECIRDYVESVPEGSGNWLAALKDRALSNALAHMHRDPRRNWTVPELAQQACLSRSAFADRFSQTLGEPPLTYLTRHRMRLAARQLGGSGLSISKIADQVGYASEAAFSQAFKREYGASPSVWRQQRLAALTSPSASPNEKAAA